MKTLKNVKNKSLLKGVWANGKRCDGKAFIQPTTAQQKSARFAVENPATASEIAQVPDQTARHAQRVVDALAAKQSAWAATHPVKRSALLYKWFELIEANAQDLALIMTLEQGKPLAEAEGEVRYGASFVQWYAEEAKRIKGQILHGATAQHRSLVLQQPVGVCASITPWNFPNAMITRKVAPALAAGCTVVLKPAELTPLSAMALAELAYQAGIPKDVFALVIGADASAIGQVFCSSDAVRHLSFTGSTEVGRILMAQCAPTIKKLALELGGNAPFMVFDDADVDAAVQGLIACKFRNAGQVCIAPNRVLVQAGIHDAFVKKLAKAAKKIELGMLVEQAGVDKVRALVADALDNGAQCVLGGNGGAKKNKRTSKSQSKTPSAGVPPNGYFYPPTILTGVAPHMRLAQEEIFGPVVAVQRFETEEQALENANNTPYGLAAYAYTRDAARIFRVSEALEYGMVGMNTGALSSAHAPFGGVKQSGLGREGGLWGLEEYLETKHVSVGA